MKELLVVIFLVIFFSGCIEHNFDGNILGEWDQFQGSSFEFKKNGTLIEYADGNIFYHEFWFDGDKLVIQWNNLFIPEWKETYNYTIKTTGEYKYLVLKVDNVDKFVMHRLIDE